MITTAYELYSSVGQHPDPSPPHLRWLHIEEFRFRDRLPNFIFLSWLFKILKMWWTEVILCGENTGSCQSRAAHTAHMSCQIWPNYEKSLSTEPRGQSNLSDLWSSPLSHFQLLTSSQQLVKVHWAHDNTTSFEDSTPSHTVASRKTATFGSSSITTRVEIRISTWVVGAQAEQMIRTSPPSWLILQRKKFH